LRAGPIIAQPRGRIRSPPCQSPVGRGCSGPADTRAYANSRWSPPYVIPEPPAGGRWQTTVTFSEPGTYVLRAVASDGSLFTYDNLTVTVTP
jgi:hypothetical protein